MNDTVKIPTKMSTTTPANDPTKPVTPLKLTSSESLDIKTEIRLKSCPRLGNNPISHWLIPSTQLVPEVDTSLAAEASLMICPTIGISTVMINASKAMMMIMVSSADSQSGK